MSAESIARAKTKVAIAATQHSDSQLARNCAKHMTLAFEKIHFLNAKRPAAGNMPAT